MELNKEYQIRPRNTKIITIVLYLSIIKKGAGINANPFWNKTFYKIWKY
jgi:hypothetical protein